MGTKVSIGRVVKVPAAVGLVLLAAALAAACGCYGPETRAEWLRTVHEYCSTATPFIAPGCLGYELPSMDDRTVLAAVKLQRLDDPEFYGDLAAVIVRLYRAQALDFPISQLCGRDDVMYLFRAGFEQCWRDFPGDEVVMSDLFHWIVRERGTRFGSPLLEEEIQKTDAVKGQMRLGRAFAGG